MTLLSAKTVLTVNQKRLHEENTDGEGHGSSSQLYVDLGPSRRTTKVKT